MAVDWQPAAEYEDIRYELSGDGIAKLTIDRPEVRNAFRPQTVIELADAFERAREDTSVGVIVLTGEGPLADRKSTRLNSSHANISYAVFCLKKKKHLRTYMIATYTQ